MSIKDPILMDSDTGEPIKQLTKSQYERVYQFHQCFRETEYGRKTLAHLEKRFWEPISFDPNPGVAAFNEGQRAYHAYIRYQLRLYDEYGHLPQLEENDHAGQSDSLEPSQRNGHYI